MGLELQFLFVKKPDRDKQHEPQIDQQPEDELDDPHADGTDHKIAHGVVGEACVMESLDMQRFDLRVQGEKIRGVGNCDIEQQQ